ncbi:hypothetical protein FOXYS1_7223 [Fusarium oxysporum]|uniref:2EXR domain-containing protein n=1 Tax=Fusarium oxysporum TaxID=5507 RepID=A0A8H5EIM4_FUSOX|nr:hypothetical protein FOXYS1_7223 [Fusarium oxysporum]
MSSPNFHPFPRLPTEIQLQIWKATCIISAIPDMNLMTYMWDGGLRGACKLSREVITEEIYSMWLRLPDYRQGYLGCPAILTSRNPHEEQGTGLPFFDPLSSSIIPVCTLAIEFDLSWIVDLPETLEELKAELYKGTLLVQKTRGYGPIYHDCGSKYNDMRERGCNDAIHAFIEALDEFLPFKEYGHLYEKNNPDSWDEDLHMWLGFNIFQEIKVLVRFEYADHKEVSWTAVRNDLDDEDEKGSEKAISAYGRVYDLEYDDDVGYCIGDFGGRRGWTYPGSG